MAKSLYQVVKGASSIDSGGARCRREVAGFQKAVLLHQHFPNSVPRTSCSKSGVVMTVVVSAISTSIQ